MAQRKESGRKAARAERRKPSAIYWAIILVAVLGLSDATFLTVTHLAGDDAVCGPSAGCSKVLSSSYAETFGLPTASFGAVAYFTVFALAILALFGYEKLRSALYVVVGCMFLATLYFLYLQTFVIHAFCPFCLLSAALTFFLSGLLLVLPARR